MTNTRCTVRLSTVQNDDGVAKQLRVVDQNSGQLIVSVDLDADRLFALLCDRTVGELDGIPCRVADDHERARIGRRKITATRTVDRVTAERYGRDELHLWALSFARTHALGLSPSWTSRVAVNRAVDVTVRSDQRGMQVDVLYWIAASIDARTARDIESRLSVALLAEPLPWEAS